MKKTTLTQQERNRRTRMKIGDTIVTLMETEDLENIKISKITETAGISRMTFYHYFETKEEALMDYLSEIILLFKEETKAKNIDVTLGTIEHIKFTFEFFSRYETYLLRLEKSGCYSILINGLNQYLEKNYRESFEKSLYGMYFYAGALLNVFLKWLSNGRKESIDEVADLIKKGFWA